MTRSLCKGRQAAPYVSSRDWTDGLLPSPHVHSLQRSGTVSIVRDSRYTGAGWKGSRFDTVVVGGGGIKGSGKGDDRGDLKGSIEAGTGTSKARTVKATQPAMISSK